MRADYFGFPLSLSEIFLPNINKETTPSDLHIKSLSLSPSVCCRKAVYIMSPSFVYISSRSVHYDVCHVFENDALVYADQPHTHPQYTNTKRHEKHKIIQLKMSVFDKLNPACFLKWIKQKKTVYSTPSPPTTIYKLASDQTVKDRGGDDKVGSLHPTSGTPIG